MRSALSFILLIPLVVSAQCDSIKTYDAICARYGGTVVIIGGKTVPADSFIANTIFLINGELYNMAGRNTFTLKDHECLGNYIEDG